MGNKQGVVWNDSSFPIEYIVYGKFEEAINSTNQTEINPNLQLGIGVDQLEAMLSGFHYKKNSGENNKYDKSFIRVEPKRFSQSGLTGLEMHKHKISIRIIIDEFQKFILNDVVIKTETDMCLKVREDQSIKNMHPAEAKKLISQNEIQSNMPGLLQSQKKQQQKLKQEWLVQLRKKILKPKIFTKKT